MTPDRSNCEDSTMWRKQSEEFVYSNYRRILNRRFETPDGVQDFEIKYEVDGAAVVALTPRQEVLLVREFRPGPEEWLLELPGGNVDDGEDPARAAPRELLEETGYSATLRYAGEMVDCAYSTRRRHVFVADDAIREHESAESLEVVLMPLVEFRDHLRSGQLTDVGAGYRALDALGLL
jgi:ADP-ribose pyrophosphatase